MTDKFYLIENEGEIDINALRLIGATTKDGETQIGYFGTGIKYALATAMRQEIPVRIFAGDREIEITTETVQMRGHDFEAICLDGEMTSITTEMGRDWETWFVLREFYCNALDEGSELPVKLTDDVSGKAGATRVYIGLTDQTHEVMTDFNLYFSTSRTPIFEAAGVKVYNRIGDKGIIYRRGVRVFSSFDSIYDYDIQSLSIDEARTSSLWDINWALIGFWKAHATPEMIVCLYNHPEKHEYKWDWDYGATAYDDSWWLTLTDRVIIPKEQAGYFADDLSEFNVQLPHRLCLGLHKKFGGEGLKIRGMLDDGFVINETQTTEKEQAMIDRAIEFLRASQYFSDIDPDIIRVAVMEKNTLGTANQGLIYLSPDVFTKGVKRVAAVIIEEWLHVKSKASDRTRLFQDTLIELTISVIEDQTGVYL